ncbi:hypothetical protein [Nostoc sp.]|uniref:hypothetical protein n=1 Tax=Nostoc sp. TaxID=1180 RepID=UPI002FF5E9BA
MSLDIACYARVSAIALQKTSKIKRSPVMEECAIALQKTSKIKRRRVAACR